VQGPDDGLVVILLLRSFLGEFTLQPGDLFLKAAKHTHHL
jgi:hypothetical protein